MKKCLFGLTYRVPKYLKSSLESIFHPDLDITVVDSRSESSEEIKEICLNYLAEGKIKRFIESSGNCKGMGLQWAYDNFKPQDDWFIMTDLDVVAYEGWLKDLSEVMDKDSTVLAGFSLSLDNYKEGWGHTEDSFGYWLMGVNSKYYKEFGRNYVQDKDLTWNARFAGKVVKLPQRLIHLSWNLEEDCPEYFKSKQQGIDWKEFEHSVFTVHEL